MSLTLISLIILLGIILLLVEFLIIPGVTVAGIGGTILIIGGVVLAYVQDKTTGTYVLLITIALLLIIFVLAFKTKTWRKLGLQTAVEGKVGVIEEDSIKVGDTGETISRLVPIGKALINDKMFEVRSDGNYIDPHTTVTVVKIQGNKIYVEPKK